MPWDEEGVSEGIDWWCSYPGRVNMSEDVRTLIIQSTGMMSM